MPANSSSPTAPASKQGVILLQFGGPDSPAAIRPFLRDLFDDPEILPYPAILRKPLAWTIAKFRTPLVVEHYAHMEGGASPIRMWTEKQAAGLRAKLGSTPVAVAMRAWKPSTSEALAELRAAGVTDLLALPLYPQYSFTTTRSSMTVLLREMKRGLPGATLRTIRSWPEEPAYIDATVATIRKGLAQFGGRTPHVLFSAHGLPMRVVEKGDPYPKEIAQTVAAVVAKAGLANGAWSQSFQSRVGYLKWLEPYTEAAIEEIAARGVKDLLVVPMSFVSDHYETIYEMGVLYGEFAKSKGVENYVVAPGLNDEPRFIDALADLVRRGFAEVPAERV